MSWATSYIDKLKKGETVQFRPRGQSMTGKISSGQLCTVEPLGKNPIEVGEIVLCKVNGNQYLHIVTAIRGDQCQISNNHGHINGWTQKSNVFGRCIKIEP